MYKWFREDQSSDDELSPELEETQKFLRLLDPVATAFSFQTYDDNVDRSDGALAKIVHGPVVKHWEALAWSNVFGGVAVAIAINETDLQGRGAGNIVRIRAIWCDYDWVKQETRKLPEIIASFPLRPSIVVRTSPGNYHFYWLFDEPFDAAGRVEFFNALMRRMVKSHGCDPDAIGINRVLHAA